MNGTKGSTIEGRGATTFGSTPVPTPFSCLELQQLTQDGHILRSSEPRVGEPTRSFP